MDGSYGSGVQSFWDLDDSPASHSHLHSHNHSHNHNQVKMDANALLRKLQSSGGVALEDLQCTRQIIEAVWSRGEAGVAQHEIQAMQQLLAEAFRLMATATAAPGDVVFSRCVSALVAIIQAVDTHVSSHYETILSVWKGFLPVFLRHWERVNEADGRVLLDILCRYSADGLKQMEAAAAALNGSADPHQELQSLTKLLVFFVTRLSAILAHVGKAIDDNGGSGSATCCTALAIFCGYRGVLELFDAAQVGAQVQKLEELFLKAVNPSISSNSKAEGLGTAKCLELMDQLIEAEATEAPMLQGITSFAALMLRSPAIHHHHYPADCLRVAVTACCRSSAHAVLQPRSSGSVVDQLLQLVQAFDEAHGSWARAHQQECLAAIVQQLAQRRHPAAEKLVGDGELAGMHLWFTLYFESRAPRDQEMLLRLLHLYALSDDANDGRARNLAKLVAELLVIAEPSVSLNMARLLLQSEQHAAGHRRTHAVVHLLQHFPFQHFWEVPEMRGFLQALYQRAVRQCVAMRGDGLFTEQLCYILGLHGLVGAEADAAIGDLVFSAIAACLLSLLQELRAPSFDDTYLALLEHAVACLMSARLSTDDMVMHGLLDLGLQVIDAAIASQGCPAGAMRRIVLALLDFTYWACKNQLSTAILQLVRDLWQGLFALIKHTDDCLLVSRIMRMLKMTAECIHSSFAKELKSFVPADMLPVMQGYLQRRTVCHKTGAAVTSISDSAAVQSAMAAKRARESAASAAALQEQAQPLQQRPYQKGSRSASSSSDGKN